MENLDLIFHICKVLYTKSQNPKSTIEEFFHQDYTQTVNGVVSNRSQYINHVIEQRKNVDAIDFECKLHMAQQDKLFIIYIVKGKDKQGSEFSVEIISYFEFKDQKVFKIHGQVLFSKGNPSTFDMNQDNL